jgi:Na+-driven multidrug efflux pump
LNLTGFMVMGFLAMNIARLAEAAFVGLLGTAELAAIAYNFPIVMGLGAASRGLGIGASSVVARSMGSGDREGSAVLVTHCLLADPDFHPHLCRSRHPLCRTAVPSAGCAR